MGVGAPQIVVAALLSVLAVIIVTFGIKRYLPIFLQWRRQGANRLQYSPDSARNFLPDDEEKRLEKQEVRQTFLYLDSASEKSSKKRRGLGIDVHPGKRISLISHPSKRKHRSRGHDFFDGASNASTYEGRSRPPSMPPPMPFSPQDYTPRGRTYYNPETPPSAQVNEVEVGLSPKQRRPLPTPVQSSSHLENNPPRYDISPMHTSTTLPLRSQLPMSFINEINARREDQTAQTVSPVLDSPTPAPRRKLSESQLSSRGVSPVSAPSTTPVITYPNATPVYLPRPMSKYNPYRPALEPAMGRNWPLDNVSVPENAAIRARGGVSPIHKHLSQSPLKPAGSSRSETPNSLKPPSLVEATSEFRTPDAVVTHPELDADFLEDFHRRRHQQQKAKEESQKHKRKGSNGNTKAQGITNNRSTKKTAKKGIPPNPALTPEPLFSTPSESPEPRAELSETTNNPRPLSAIRRAINAAVTGPDHTTGLKPQPLRPTTSSSPNLEQRPRTSPSVGITGRKHSDHSIKARPATADRKKSYSKESTKTAGPPPRVPSKSRKPSQSPEAYEKARQVSGIHELLGSVSSTPAPGSPVVSEAASAHSRRMK